MAVIRVDFDEVMRFGDLHRDISTSLKYTRSVFDRDAQHLDRIINEFGLPRVTNNPHFAGLSIQAAFDDADARALRVARGLMETSSRIFRQAQPVDSHFDWALNLSAAVSATFSSPESLAPLMAGLEFVGGKLVEKVVEAGAAAVLSPGVIFIAPAFLLVIGGLAFHEGWVQIHDAAGEVWEQIAGGLKLVSGGITFLVGTAGLVVLVAGGSVAALLAAPVVGAALAIAALAGVAALLIDHRDVFAHALGFDETAAERTGNKLLGAGSGSIPLGPTKGPTIIAEFPAPSGFGAGSRSHTPAQLLQHGPTVAILPESPPPASLVTTPAPTMEPPEPITPSPTPAGRTILEVQEKYDFWADSIQHEHPNFSDPTQSQYQCTGWANFRWHELGYDGIVHGNAGPQMLENVPTLLSSSPTLHAMAIRNGHVMIVEEIAGDGSWIRVSEMNTGSDWEVGRPEEFMDTDKLHRNPGGNFYEKDSLIQFAPFPLY